MARVSKNLVYTNPVKSITFIPDHYVTISVTAETSSVQEYKAGQPVKIDFSTLAITDSTLMSNDANAIVFADTKVHENEGTPVSVLIHGFVNKAKLITPEKLGSTTNHNIIILGSEDE